MAGSVVAIQEGFDFQARLFWLRAIDLLDPNKGVSRVSYELGPKGFDDITVEYAPGKGRLDQCGARVLRKYYQCKWHSTGKDFGYEDLTRPDFINATAHSFLQRALAAQQAHAPNGEGSKFHLVTNWRVSWNDPLARLIRKVGDGLDLDRLAEGGPRSMMGGIRKCWSDHLGIDEAALMVLARTLVISDGKGNLEELRENLDDRLSWAGMRRIDPSASTCLYDDLIRKLHGQGRKSFDRDEFSRMLKDENLLTGETAPQRSFKIGLRSRLHPYADLESRCDDMLDILPHFDDRAIRDPAGWNGAVRDEVITFVRQEAGKAGTIRLCLDAHVSIAFLAGMALGTKSRVRVEIEQDSFGLRVWSRDDGDPGTPGDFHEEILGAGGGDIALAAGLSNEIGDDVRRHVAAHLPNVGRILHLRPSGGPSQMAVVSGRHAFRLAEAAKERLVELSRQARPGACHLFIAAPNTFSVFLGQFQAALGKCALYEFDFEGSKTYSPSIIVP